MTMRNTSRTYRFIASLMAAGLLFLAACDNNDPGLLGPSTELTDSLTITFDRSPTPEPPIGLRRAEPRGAPEVVLPVERYTSVGAFSDRGGYREQLAFDDSQFWGWRELSGRQGSASILFTGMLTRTGQTRRVHGTAEIIGAAGLYRAFTSGSGSFAFDLDNPHGRQTITIQRPDRR